MGDQPGGTGERNAMDLVQEYKKQVLEYETLDDAIDDLIARHHGATENMTDEDRQNYRQLAYHRDDVYNQMKALERLLLDE